MIAKEWEKLIAKEWEQQATFIEYFGIKYPYLTIFHIPNGEKRDKGTAIKLKKMGVLPGVSDLYLMEYKCFIEFKRSKKDKVTKDQKDFMEKAVETGHKVIVFYGIDDAMKKIDKMIRRH